jgi:pyruvate/2-oxoglutarate dehydrogenase complex dihydrolipoamide dehydrogenase (E3) component
MSRYDDDFHVIGSGAGAPHSGGHEAAEMIPLVAAALKMGAAQAQFDSTFALRPSAAQELVTMWMKSFGKNTPR